MMNRVYATTSVLIAAFFVLLFCGCGGDNATDHESSVGADSFKIGIVYTEPHPVLTTIAEAFKEEVKAKIANVEFVEKHGSGSKAQYPATVRSVLSDNVNLIAPITTPMSIETLKQAEGIVPVVFLGVTDPVGSKLVQSLEKPIRCSGVSDNPPMASVINLVGQFYPGAKSIGIPYDPKDQPGVVTANRAAELAKEQGLQPYLRPVATESELRSAVRGLASSVDAVIIGMDNLMMKNAGIISRTLLDQGKPLFAADDKSVDMGAVAGVGVDYTDVGRLGGKIAVMVLLDKTPIGEIPVQMLSTGEVYFNTDAAEKLGVTIPDEVMKTGRSTTKNQDQ